MLRIHHVHEVRLSFQTPLRVAVVDFDPEPPCPPEPEPDKGAVLPVVRAQFPGGLVVTAKGTQMAYVLPDGMHVGLTVSYVDAGGNPAKVDGGVHWESSDPNIIDLQAAPDGASSATVVALALGTAQVIVRADADLGDGVRELICMLDVEVVAGEAVAGVITPVGGPEAK